MRPLLRGGRRRPPRPAHARDGHAARRLSARRVLDLVGDGLRQLPEAPAGRAHPARADGARRRRPDRPRRRRLRAHQPRAARARGWTSSRWATARRSSRRSRRSCAATSRATRRSPPSRTSRASTSRRSTARAPRRPKRGRSSSSSSRRPRAPLREPPHTTILTPHTELSDKLLIEIARGCSEMCRFCWAAYAMAPQVRISAESVLEVARRNRPLTGARRASSRRPWRTTRRSSRSCAGSQALEYHIALSSVKIDAISEEILAILTAQGERALAIAPEAGNERLRRAINKKVSDEMLLEKVRLIARSGITQLKLYLQVGLPGRDGRGRRRHRPPRRPAPRGVPRGGAHARARRDARPDGERVHPEAAHAVREREPRRPDGARGEDEAPRRGVPQDAERLVPRDARRRGDLGGVAREDGRASRRRSSSRRRPALPCAAS